LQAGEETDDTYIKVVVRRFALKVGNHCDRGLGGVSRELTVSAESEEVEGTY
jgi:hypothetical protein